MIEKIREKMEAHIISILEKPAISNEEYTILSGYLSKLEIEAEMEKNREENEKRFRALMDCAIGGLK